MGRADERWAEQLAAWAIPEEILSQATADPWKLTPAVFASRAPADAPPPDTPSRRLALEALGEGGSVLDVGVGAGGASLHLAPAASVILGVDEAEDMLAAFAAKAVERGVSAKTFAGRWPDIAGEVPAAEVVVSHHVLYNVPDLGPFVVALTGHARRRVVVEIGARHPVHGMNPLWMHFWDLDRPEGPVAEDALAVLAEAGVEARSERDVRPGWLAEVTPERVAHLTRRLCLAPERAPEVEEALATYAQPAERETVTIWWDGTAG